MPSLVIVNISYWPLIVFSLLFSSLPLGKPNLARNSCKRRNLRLPTLETVLEVTDTVGGRKKDSFANKHQDKLCQTCSRVRVAPYLVLLSLFLVLLLYVGWVLIISIVLITTLLAVLNYYRFVSMDKLLVITIITAFAVVFIINGQKNIAFSEHLGYFLFQNMLLCLAPLPFILFFFKKRKYLLVSIALPLPSTIGYNFIQHWVGIGIYLPEANVSVYSLPNWTILPVCPISTAKTYSFKTYLK